MGDMEVDEALAHLGKFGKWQMITYSMVCLSVTVSGCWHMMVIVFTGGEPVHHCKIPDGYSINETIPFIKEGTKKKWKYSECSKYANLSLGNDTMTCNNGWDYDDEFVSTIVTEWDLVCDRNYMVEISQSMFALGVMVGAIAFTALADKIGRKPVHLACQWSMLIVGVAIAYAPNYISFAVLRFILGAIREGAGLTGIVMACELFPAAQRTFAGTTLELFWAGAWMALAGIAYFIRDWRHLQLAVTIPPILTIGLYWLLPESVPWLAANEYYEKAEKILRKAAKFNKIKFPDSQFLKRELSGHEMNKLTKEESEKSLSGHKDQENGEITTPVDREKAISSKGNDLDSPSHDCDGVNGKDLADKEAMKTLLDKPSKNKIVTYFSTFNCGHGRRETNKPVGELEEAQYSCLDIAKSKSLLLYACIMCSLWVASGIVYYGLSLSTNNLAGDKYLNFFLSGAVEAPAYLMTIFVLERWGRRWPLCIFHIVAGVVLFVNIFIPEETASGTDLTPVITTLTMIGKFAMTASFGTVVLYAPEIFPTNLRNVGFGLASMAGRLATTLAPFTGYIGKSFPWIPGVIYTIISITTGLLVLLLPETLNRPLPSTIEEIEGWKRMSLKEHRMLNQIRADEIRDKNAKRLKGETVV